MRRFVVDEVVQASDRLPTEALGERYPNALAVGGDRSARVIHHGGTHPLLAAVGLAFAQHRPLVLSPDAVWLTIAQGVAQHVRLHAEALRPQLVRHSGRKRLAITTNIVPTTAEAWASVVEKLRARLAEEVGDGRARLFECDFSTTTDVDRLASQIVLLDVYSPYFSYWMMAVCGIPEITLLGTVEDWRRIRERLDVIAEFDLAFWCRSLAPIIDQFVRAAAGDVDVSFWRRIYNPADAYGGEIITGWVTRLYPYVKQGGTLDARNPMLDLPIDEPKHRTSKSNTHYRGPGLRSDSVPAAVSRVTVHIVDQIAREQKSVALVGGVTAVAQDEDGALRPITGWHLEHATPSMSELVERIAAEHHVVRATPDERSRFVGGPAEVVELFSQIESATLFEGDRTWKLRAPRDQQGVHVERGGQFSIRRIADLANGRSVCAAFRHDTGETHWIACEVEDLRPTTAGDFGVVPGISRARELPSEIRLLGSSFAAMLDAALASDGDIEHLEVGRFDELLRI